MRYYHGMVLALLAPVVVSTTPSCVPLIGIEKDGDGTATLNLDDMRVSLELEVFDFNNAVVPALVACSSGWFKANIVYVRVHQSCPHHTHIR